MRWFGITVRGNEKLARKLRAMDSIKYEEIRTKTLLQMWKVSEHNTPVKTGALKRSRTMFNNSFAYQAPYARYVEYGHKMPQGEYIPGRYYLKETYETVKPDYIKALKDALKEGD